MSGPEKLADDCFALPPGVDWTPVDAALARLRQGMAPVTGIEPVPAAAAMGRVLAAPVCALRANPPAANAAVDGFGFAFAGLAANGRGDFALLPGRAAAGAPYGGPVGAGQALRILTGAILPPGVDTIVMQEDVISQGGRVAFSAGLKAHANTRAAGEDVAAGAVILAQGRRLRAPDLALIAATGVDTVSVFKRLRVGVLSSGDEICVAGQAVAAHQTYDANRPMLLAMVHAFGHDPVDLGCIPDDPGALRSALDCGAVGCDAIITSGGASGGDEDHLSHVLREFGRLETWRVAVKPGRPLALGLWQGMPVFGLPGNPVAACVCTLIFARPALSVLAGGGWVEPAVCHVPAAFAKRKKAGRREFLRARLNAAGAAEIFKSEGSGRISGLAWADGLVELPDEAGEVHPGDMVRYLPYHGFGLA